MEYHITKMNNANNMNDAERDRIFERLLKKAAEKLFCNVEIFEERNEYTTCPIAKLMDSLFAEINVILTTEYPDNGRYETGYEAQTDYIHALLHRMFQVVYKYASNEAVKKQVQGMGIIFCDQEIGHQMCCDTHRYTNDQNAECMKELLDIISVPTMAPLVEHLKDMSDRMAHRRWEGIVLPEEWEALNANRFRTLPLEDSVAYRENVGNRIGARLAAIAMATVPIAA